MRFLKLLASTCLISLVAGGDSIVFLPNMDIAGNDAGQIHGVRDMEHAKEIVRAFLKDKPTGTAAVYGPRYRTIWKKRATDSRHLQHAWYKQLNGIHSFIKADGAVSDAEEEPEGFEIPTFEKGEHTSTTTTTTAVQLTEPDTTTETQYRYLPKAEKEACWRYFKGLPPNPILPKCPLIDLQIVQTGPDTTTETQTEYHGGTCKTLNCYNCKRMLAGLDQDWRYPQCSRHLLLQIDQTKPDTTTEIQTQSHDLLYVVSCMRAYNNLPPLPNLPPCPFLIQIDQTGPDAKTETQIDQSKPDTTTETQTEQHKLTPCERQRYGLPLEPGTYCRRYW